MTATEPRDTTGTEAVWAAIAVERRRMADELETLTEQEWSTPSQCDAWTVEQLAAHLVTPFETSMPRFMFTMAKNRGDFDRAIIELTARTSARNTRAQVITKLRQHAENRWTPPRAGAEIMLAEIVVHGQDIRRPLGHPNSVPDATIALALSELEEDLRADYADRIGLSS